MELFEVKEGILTFAPQALALKPFKKLWTRDRKKNKPLANAELAAVYFYVDYKSDFSDIFDPKEKLEIIRDWVDGLPDDWKPDSVFDEACAFYEERQKTMYTELLEAAGVAIDKLSKYFRNIDLEERDMNNKPVHDAKKVKDNLAGLGKLIKDHKELEQEVKKDLQKKTARRGGKEKSMFEAGI
jgi:hypothetical protein